MKLAFSSVEFSEFEFDELQLTARVAARWRARRRRRATEARACAELQIHRDVSARHHRRSRRDSCSRDGQLYESTGLQGESSLRRVDIATGQTLQRIDVPTQYFAEGLALVGDELLQLTWQHKLGFVYDRKTFKQKRTFSYTTEGWGIAYDGASQLVMSDGSDTLTFLDPKTFAATKTLRVLRCGPAGGEPQRAGVDRRRDLGQRVDDRSHRADLAERPARSTRGSICRSLFPAPQRVPPADELNGIAYDKATRRIFITGKKWPRLYQITVS